MSEKKYFRVLRKFSLLHEVGEIFPSEDYEGLFIKSCQYHNGVILCYSPSSVEEVSEQEFLKNE